VVMTARGSAAMFLALRDWWLELNQAAPSTHTPHTGMRWGLPEGRTVASQ
jgi:hypothetical protein